MKYLILFCTILYVFASCQSDMFCKLYQKNCDIQSESDTVIVNRVVTIKTDEIDTFKIEVSRIDTIVTTNCDSIVQDLNNLEIENDAIKTTVKVDKDQNGNITAKVETERKQQTITQKDSSEHEIKVTDTTFNQVDTIPCEPKRYVPDWFKWVFGFSVLLNLILIFIRIGK